MATYAFVDDLMVFSDVDVGLIRIIKDALNHFQAVSGLQPNLSKSAVFFNGVAVL